LGRAGAFLLKSHIFTVWLALGALGFWVGAVSRPDRSEIPYDDLFENLRVVSYREAPSDTTVHFVVDLAARGRAFRRYDVDSRTFGPPARSHDYWRSISGTQYAPLRVRGHVNRGFWLELPDSNQRSLLPDQFDELYNTTLDFVKPVSLVTSVLGVLSGYSVGYRLATWGHSISNPKVQDRLLALPNVGRAIAREAWRRVALEPVMVYAENDAGRFAAVDGRQRLYASFFRLAVNDSNGFIPYEAARLDSMGHAREARAMVAFVNAVRRVAADTSDLTSADFSAVEEWASLLDRHGHWSYGAWPPAGPERIRYLGTLAWYGLAPDAPDRRRLWVGPRLLVKDGDAEAFIPDEIPSIREGCPTAWREWIAGDQSALSANEWTARWMGDAKPFEPVVRFVMSASRGADHAMRAVAEAQATRRDAVESHERGATGVNAAGAGAAVGASAAKGSVHSSGGAALLATARADSTPPDTTIMADEDSDYPDSSLRLLRRHALDPVIALPKAEKRDSTVLRASFGPLTR
jgi:hypothetical protein